MRNLVELLTSMHFPVYTGLVATKGIQHRYFRDLMCKIKDTKEGEQEQKKTDKIGKRKYSEIVIGIP